MSGAFFNALSKQFVLTIEPAIMTKSGEWLFSTYVSTDIDCVPDNNDRYEQKTVKLKHSAVMSVISPH